jgi:RNase P subunit RPR2
MKPAFNTASPSLAPGNIVPKPVLCLRCQQRLERYSLSGSTTASKGTEWGHATLVCPNCGHIEFVSEKSPLLDNLEMAYVDTGDGD